MSDLVQFPGIVVKTEPPKRLPVECGTCGWTGIRKPGKLVWCPKCGSCAGFQPKEQHNG